MTQGLRSPFIMLGMVAALPSAPPSNPIPPAQDRIAGSVLTAPNTYVTLAGPWQSHESSFFGRPIQIAKLESLPPPPAGEIRPGILAAAATATWREALSAADRQNKSIGFAPNDLNEPIGLTVIANRLGPNPGIGPVRRTVAALWAVTPNGEAFANISRTRNPDLFRLVPGSFYAAAIPRQVDFKLVPNGALQRMTAVMPASDYPAYFRRQVGPSSALHPAKSAAEPASGAVMLHEAILYLPSLQTARAVSWVATGQPLTITRRLAVPADRSWWTRALARAVLHLPGGAWLRRWIADPLFYAGRPVVSLNYALTGGASDLLALPATEPAYGRQEYYVPVEKYDDFRLRLAAILDKYEVPVASVTVRFSSSDSESILAWAKTDVFGFTVTFEKTAVATAWSREAIDASLELGGSFDLASQMNVATIDEIYRAYPRLADFFSLKMRFDLENRFHDAFCDLVFPAKYLELLVASGNR